MNISILFLKEAKSDFLLAYALLTVVMHIHNISVKVGGKLVVRPITASPLRGTHSTNTKPIGIMPKEQLREQNLQTADHWEIDIPTNNNVFWTHIANLFEVISETADITEGYVT